MHNLRKTTSLVSGLATDCTAVAAADDDDDDDDDRSNLFTTVVILKKNCYVKVHNSKEQPNKTKQVPPDIANLVPRPTAGRCHLANLTA